MNNLIDDIGLKKLDEIKTLIHSRSRNWLIVFGLAVIILLVLLIVVFRKTTKDPYIEQGSKEIELLKRNNALLDSLLKSKDTVLIENKKTETRIITKYENIPADVRSLDREQLRREVTNY